MAERAAAFLDEITLFQEPLPNIRTFTSPVPGRPPPTGLKQWPEACHMSVIAYPSLVLPDRTRSISSTENVSCAVVMSQPAQSSVGTTRTALGPCRAVRRVAISRSHRPANNRQLGPEHGDDHSWGGPNRADVPLKSRVNREFTSLASVGRLWAVLVCCVLVWAVRA